MPQTTLVREPGDPRAAIRSQALALGFDAVGSFRAEPVWTTRTVVVSRSQ